MKGFLRWIEEVDTTTSQQVVAVLKTRTERQKSLIFASIFADTDDYILEQDHQVLRESTAVQIYAASDAGMGQHLSTLFRKQASLPFLLKRRTFFQSILAKKKALMMSRLLQSVSTTTKALPIFRGIGYVNSCLQDCHLHAKLY